MILYHYYDRRSGPFRSLSDLTDAQTGKMLERIRRERPASMCAGRQASYLADRRRFEELLRGRFMAPGGKPKRQAPHYLVVGPCPWLWSWYEDPGVLSLPVDRISPDVLSFSYGDSHPTFSPVCQDGREYRSTLYRMDGIRELIGRYGLPQHWNRDGQHGPERYVEAQIWDDDPLLPYLEGAETSCGTNPPDPEHGPG